MIRVLYGFRTSTIQVKTSSRRGIQDAPLASLSRSIADNPLPRRDDSSTPGKRKRKKS